MSIIIITIAFYFVFGDFASWVKLSSFIGLLLVLWLMYRLNVSVSKSAINSSIDIDYLSERNKSEQRIAEKRNIFLAGFFVMSIVSLTIVDGFEKYVIWFQISVATCIFYYFYSNAVLNSLSNMLIRRMGELENK